MAEILHEYTTKVRDELGSEFRARAWREERSDGAWATWLEFIPTAGGANMLTDQESSQPGRDEAVYWAGGLEPIYLDGALKRARRIALA